MSKMDTITEPTEAARLSMEDESRWQKFFIFGKLFFYFSWQQQQQKQSNHAIIL
jgi:hypothetical protein